MFGSLIIVLPAEFSGCSLFVKHQEQVLRFNANAGNPAAVYAAEWMAFYADCMHELEPLESGCGLCLVYNLCGWIGLSAAALFDGLYNLSNSLSEFAKGKTVKGVMFPLQHEYTLGSFGPAALKGHDRVAFQALKRLVTDRGLTLLLTLRQVKLTTEDVELPEPSQSTDFTFLDGEGRMCVSPLDQKEILVFDPTFPKKNAIRITMTTRKKKKRRKRKADSMVPTTASSAMRPMTGPWAIREWAITRRRTTRHISKHL